MLLFSDFFATLAFRIKLHILLLWAKTAPDKSDILNGYALAMNVNGSVIVYFGVYFRTRVFFVSIESEFE